MRRIQQERSADEEANAKLQEMGRRRAGKAAEKAPCALGGGNGCGRQRDEIGSRKEDRAGCKRVRHGLSIMLLTATTEHGGHSGVIRIFDMPFWHMTEDAVAS